MIIKTSELSGKALDWAVAECCGLPELGSGWSEWWFEQGEWVAESRDGVITSFSPSSDWGHGGPIIEQMSLCIMKAPGIGFRAVKQFYCDEPISWHPKGGSMLVAAMRAVVSELKGDQIEVPDEIAEKGPCCARCINVVMGGVDMERF